MIRTIRSTDKGFSARIDAITSRGAMDSSGVEDRVKIIIDDVKGRGDAALVEYTARFDKVDLQKGFEVTKAQIDRAVASLPKDEIRLIKLSASRIAAFHKRQLQRSWTYKDEFGSTLGQKVTPMERVGIYVPGGKAAYPSTVLMNAIPARVAGVKEVIMVTPPNKDGANPYVLAAAKVAGVDRIFTVGGAQSIAALAYGTKSIPKVHKITGPGNIYVATAKKLVYGTVDIDMIAGPSEILVINDGTGNARWIALDLLSQAEHDELASGILITTCVKMARAVSEQIEELLCVLKRRDIARKSINSYGAIILVKNLKEAAAISNRIAPEHLELAVKRPNLLLKSITNAGAVFLGTDTPEAAGDYLAGPNHTLPTGGTAKFSSPLGVEDFLKKTSIIGFSRKAMGALGARIKKFADLEGLEAHGLSAGARLEKNPK